MPRNEMAVLLRGFIFVWQLDAGRWSVDSNVTYVVHDYVVVRVVGHDGEKVQ